MTPDTPDIPATPEFPSDAEDAQPIDWFQLFTFLWSSRKFILKVTSFVAVAAVIGTLLMPNYYESTATILPETGTGKLSALAGLSDLASLAGINVGAEASMVQLYPAIVASETVLRNVIYAKYRTQEFEDSVTLVEFWRIEMDTNEEEHEEALKSLRNGLTISPDRKTNVVNISIMTKEPQLSADIINNVCSELDLFIRNLQTTNASEQRKWVDTRLREVQKDLEGSENRLKVFREKNRRVGDSPQLLLEQGRLLRDVEINSVLYQELKKQYEIARIEEVKNIPFITIMDAARPAAKKSQPRRSIIVIVATLLGGTIAIGFLLASSRYQNEISRFVGIFRSSSYRSEEDPKAASTDNDVDS